jgi:hypothetical protein
MWDFVMDKSGAGAGFLQELRFPLPIYIPSACPQSSSLSPEAGTIGRSGRSASSLTNQIKNIYIITKWLYFCLLHVRHQRCIDLGVMVRSGEPNDSERYTGGSVATGTATQTGRVKDKR